LYTDIFIFVTYNTFLICILLKILCSDCNATCKTQEFEIKKENIINISLENGKKDLMRVFINLNNSDDIELVQLSNTIELAKFMDIMLNT
jgi:hypothetical protein